MFLWMIDLRRKRPQEWANPKTPNSRLQRWDWRTFFEIREILETIKSLTQTERLYEGSPNVAELKKQETRRNDVGGGWPSWRSSHWCPLDAMNL